MEHEGNINQPFGEDGQFLHSAFSLLLCFEKWWGLNWTWPCVVAPGEADVRMRTGSSSVVLLHGLCSAATWNYTQLSHKTNMTHIHTHLYLTAKWKSHSFVQTRRENNRWAGHRCANYTTLAMSRITLPPAKITRVHCRWLNHFTDRRVVLALEWDETSGDVRIRQIGADPPTDVPLTCFQLQLTQWSKHEAVSGQLSSFWSWTGFCWCSLGLQPARVTSWTHSGTRRECSDCRHEFTVKVHQAMLSRLWPSS